jgi:cytochrome c554/c'-like protein
MVDGGDLMGRRNKNDQFQTRFLCEVTGDFGYDGIGLGEADLNYGLPFLREMIEKYDLPFTSANVVDRETGELILPEYLVAEKNGIKFGLVSVLGLKQKIITMTDTDSGLEAKDPVATLRELLPRMRKEVDTVVLLGHLGDGDTEALLNEVKGIDICLMGHSRRTVKSERIVEDTVVLGSGHEGQFVGRADIFVEKSDGKVMAVEVDLISLDQAIADDQEMAQRVVDYKASFAEFKLAKRKDFPRDLGSDKESYLGARACKTCHQETWAAYTESAHSKAFMSIRSKGQSNEPECILCHSTGYRYKQGYSDERPYNKMVNVQCEACHGYGTEHSRDGKWLAQAKDSCVTCHDQKNSPDFDYELYWEKIKH